MTTRPCETRAASAGRVGASRNARIERAWIAAKSGSSSGATRTTLDVSRFSPCSPARRAEPSLAAPYQSRSARPGECGWTWSENDSMPSVPEKVLAGSPRRRRWSRATRS